MTPADTSVADIVLWAAALSALISFGGTIWMIFSGPARKNGTRLDQQAALLAAHDLRLGGLDHATAAIPAHTSRLEAQEQRIGAVENVIRAIPTKDELHELELAMTRLQGELKTMSETMRGQGEIMKRVESLVGRHEDHLLKK